jgi:rhamnose transport system ATP-binding protein
MMEQIDESPCNSSLMPSPLLRALGISKSFAGVRALNGASLDVNAGEVHALVGENGAGKSTLIKVITGVVTADAGALEIDGSTIENHQARLARTLGIAAIYQQPALFPDLSVAENIALTLETGSVWRKVDWKARTARAKALLDRVGAYIDPARLASTLSMPEQQMVEIAKAIGADARILIMDEPTSSLTDVEVERLFRVIADLRAQGSCIVYISHRLEEIFAIADRITVLRDGETVGTYPRDGLTRAEVIHRMVGRELSAVFPKHEVPIGEIALELRDVSSRASRLLGISLTLRRGEILGLAGLVGSGRTELAETIFGLRPIDSGEILRDGKTVQIRSPAQAIQCGIAYVPEDRRQHGVVMEMPIHSNVSLASLATVSTRGLINGSAERDLARNYIGQLRIKAESAEALAGTLSGGNQQKVALARWLVTNPAVLILDEPTQGVDVSSKQEIHKLMVDLAGRGLAILMISSELPEILGMSDRIAVMHNGSLRATLSRQDATSENVLALALGHSSGLQ